MCELHFLFNPNDQLLVLGYYRWYTEISMIPLNIPNCSGNGIWIGELQKVICLKDRLLKS